MSNHSSRRSQGVSRRAFLGGTLAAGATGLLPLSVFAQGSSDAAKLREEIPDGDIAILRFLAAAELVEDDLWQQYTELATNNRAYNRALRLIDRSLIRYINDDRDDERSHAQFINAFLVSIGEDPINLDPFRTLPSVPVEGADQGVKRITNLTNLTVDTSWYNRYRGAGNPDLGDSFPQLLDLKNVPTIPTKEGLSGSSQQALAQTAAFHFAAIEQGGGSLYTALLSKVSHPTVVRILASIGPTEVYHFATFHKSLEGIFELRRSRVSFPDLRSNRDLAEATFPEPCAFLDRSFPLCSIIRPSNIENAGAVAAATGLVASGLFEGQSKAFFDAVVALATAADAAERKM